VASLVLRGAVREGNQEVGGQRGVQGGHSTALARTKARRQEWFWEGKEQMGCFVRNNLCKEKGFCLVDPSLLAHVCSCACCQLVSSFGFGGFGGLKVGEGDEK
jgi:hypothetical protein